MLAIKFKRVGKKHQASFRIIVKEKRSKVFGRSVEDLGWFNPQTTAFDLKKDRIIYWLKVGAQPTPSIHNLLVRAEILKTDKIAVHKKAKKQTKEEVATPVKEKAAAVEAESKKETELAEKTEPAV